MGRLGAILEALGWVLGGSWVALGGSWVALGVLWGSLGGSWVALRGLLGRSWGTWGALGPSWGDLGGSWVRLDLPFPPLSALGEPGARNLHSFFELSKPPFFHLTFLLLFCSVWVPSWAPFLGLLGAQVGPSSAQVAS